jgi:hypothetical protein
MSGSGVSQISCESFQPVIPSEAEVRSSMTQRGSHRNVNAWSCRPGTAHSAAATIGLIFAGALSAFFDQDR